MNPIQQLYISLSDEELTAILTEIKESDITGVLPDNSLTRNLCREAVKITGMDVSSNLLMVQIGVLKEGAYRWLSLK